MNFNSKIPTIINKGVFLILLIIYGQNGLVNTITCILEEDNGNHKLKIIFFVKINGIR